MSRPVMLVFLLLVLIITSQFEWKQQIVNNLETDSNISQRQQQRLKTEESIKEKIILSQEKKIQILSELVRTLGEGLKQCKESRERMNSTNSVTSNVNEVGLPQHLPED